MADSVDDGVSRREFVHGAVAGALLAAAPAAVLATASGDDADKAAVWRRFRRCTLRT